MHWKSYVVGSVGDVKTDLKNSLNNLWVTLINYKAQLTQEQYLSLLWLLLYQLRFPKWEIRVFLDN